MYALKVLSPEAIPRSLERAERYRILNEPAEAESICLDVLHIDPDNQHALVTLLLALTDQLDSPIAFAMARDLLPRLRGEYERAYFGGIVCERRAKARLRHGDMSAGHAAYEWLREAMELYEQAEARKPPGNDDAALRWNTCARLLMQDARLQPAGEHRLETMLE